MIGDRDRTGRAGDIEGFIAGLLKRHTLHCRDPHCPFANPERPLVLAERFEPECDETGGWSHCNRYGAIGWAGEYLTHLAIPEICLHGGIRLPTTPMDGNTPQGEAEIKTATACAHTNGETRWAFTVRPSQRRDHALPLICVGMNAGFVPALSGRRLVLPACAAQVALSIDAVFLIPLGAYSSPERTSHHFRFAIPGAADPGHPEPLPLGEIDRVEWPQRIRKSESRIVRDALTNCVLAVRSGRRLLQR